MRNRKVNVKAQIIMITLSTILILAGCSSPSEDKTDSAGSDLVIPIDSVTETANFYKATVDGAQLEVIAVRAPDGTIRTAFNTCQICYDSGRGYYEQVGDLLVCQNCGNKYEMSQIETEENGCNPWPIFSDNKTVDDDSIIISYDYLKECASTFESFAG